MNLLPFKKPSLSHVDFEGDVMIIRKEVAEGKISYQTHLFAWLFFCRRKLYRDRILCRVKRDENFKVIRDKDGHIEFLEDPKQITPKLTALNDDKFYNDYVFPRLNSLCRSSCWTLGYDHFEKGKETLRQKLMSGEYALTSESLEYARAKIFMELEADTESIRIAARNYDLLEEFDWDFPITDRYFEEEMQHKLDPDYVDELTQSRLGQARINSWKTDPYDIERAQIQIDHYCKEFLAQKGGDSFMLFDNVTEKLILPKDLEELRDRYTPFIADVRDFHRKYEAIMGQGQ